jgi:FkbM family methyltransferase
MLATQFSNPLRLAKALSGSLPARWQQQLNKVYHRYTIRREQEPSEFRVLRHFVQDGELIVDAGANVGLYTVFLARCAPPGCHVLAIEPIPTTFEVLSDTVASLGLTNVTLVSCAVSDQPRQVVMEIPAAADGHSVHALARITYTDQPRRLAATYHVEARPLDHMLQDDRRRVSLIKFDVEMHELQAITGALGVIRRNRPAIYVEIQPDLRFKPSQRDDIIALLAPEGYRPFCYDGAAVTPWSADRKALDYLFLTDAHCHQLAAAGLLVPAERVAALC